MLESFHRWLDRKLRIDAYELRGDEILAIGLRSRRIRLPDVRVWQSYYIGGGSASVCVEFEDGRKVDYSDSHRRIEVVGRICTKKTGIRVALQVDASGLEPGSFLHLSQYVRARLHRQVGSCTPDRMRDLLNWLNTTPPAVGILLAPFLSLISALIVAIISRRGVMLQIRNENQRFDRRLEHEAREKTTEREMQTKREVFMTVCEGPTQRWLDPCQRPND